MRSRWKMVPTEQLRKRNEQAIDQGSRKNNTRVRGGFKIELRESIVWAHGGGEQVLWQWPIHEDLTAKKISTFHQNAFGFAFCRGRC